MRVRAFAMMLLASVATAATDPRRSGYDDMTPQLQAMQGDDAANPAMLGVADGAALWERVPAAGLPSCATCHGDASTAMRGIAARYPAFDAAARRPVTLAQRINACRVEHQQAAPLAAESDALLGLEAFVAMQSRGLPIAPPADPRLQPYRARGEALFRQRLGQLDFSCAQCHDDHAGQRLGGATIPQAHPTGYPIYRLEWQGLGSLQRRLRSCMTGVRAEPFAAGAPEWVELELYLAQRAAGMTVETPAVRP
ncbi:sulfur oxidation c-type cytochrome SoxA [Rhizobacter sp. Root404]|uniref:sulfur oxidation c-type cytochrome SoxA n=1 Tax=Rhizobacter sp. Root404 TaxID=1736528 RepID=UPI0006F29CAD|nr:sulfur oxidation c-type cytochrome SoxA [Rhizobacter sp. Root404]KQW40021.1 sulfur oxidation c-type cytochrome SoxA [Rhizobacter sp. Root404]